MIAWRRAIRLNEGGFIRFTMDLMEYFQGAKCTSPGCMTEGQGKDRYVWKSNGYFKMRQARQERDTSLLFRAE